MRGIFSDMSHPTPAALVLASVERLAARFPREALVAMWAVIDAHHAGSPELPALAAAALEDAASLSRYADASNECGPGFPRDDPGPWHWSALASLTRAAALASSDPELALHTVDMAAYEVGYPTRELQEAERRFRAEQQALSRA